MIYDLAIIGGGPAGYSAALEAIKYGLLVVVFEGELLGGTCLNRGCIPTKFLAHSAELFSTAKNNNRYGISIRDVCIDFSVTMEQMNQIIQKSRGNLTSLLEQKRINIIYGQARAIDTNTIECQGQIYNAKNLLIATGSKASAPIVDGAYSSDDTLKLDSIPKRVKILGGGVVAVEFANIFNKLGCEVTISIRGERILRKWDKEIAVSVTQSLKGHGVTIFTKCSTDDFIAGDYDFVLSAAGRTPRVDGIEIPGLEFDSFNAIITDELGRTNLEHVFAAGDVVSGSPMLAHVGMNQGKIVARYIAGKKVLQPSAVPSCIYYNPEIASVGITEAIAKERGIEVIIGKKNMVSNARTMIATEERNFIKIVADKHTHKILGAQLMCERATDIVSELVIIINEEITVEEVLNAVYPHPSFSETILDVMEAILEKANGV